MLIRLAKPNTMVKRLALPFNRERSSRRTDKIWTPVLSYLCFNESIYDKFQLRCFRISCLRLMYVVVKYLKCLYSTHTEHKIHLSLCWSGHGNPLHTCYSAALPAFLNVNSFVVSDLQSYCSSFSECSAKVPCMSTSLQALRYQHK